ncbi:MAG: hypothetical protein AAFY28_09040, partial [Actinomycetota bacterium]
MTLRGVYYRLQPSGLIEKTENDYRKVGRELLKLRRNGDIAYDDITDGTRYVLKDPSFRSKEDALANWAGMYRQNLWTGDTRIEVFTEKDAISGVIAPVCTRWDVPLGIQRGYASESFTWRVGHNVDPDVFTIMVQLGDHDPSGVGAWEDFAGKVLEFADLGATIDFVRLAVTPEQIDE